MSKIRPFLWFDSQAEEAANYYVSIFPNSKIIKVWKFGDNVMGASFELEGQRFDSLNGGPQFKFTEAVSFYVDCEDQAEVDQYWDRLIADGGTESQCGWLKDKYGLSWQIIPKQLGILTGDPNPAKANAAMQAMLKMKKIIVKNLQTAYDQA